jgi:predicted Rossmann fold nucleotide-binding protein DprA/Smf involved in DNA uptake
MTEIAQLFESALRQNRATLLRKAAINTVAKMPASTRLSELLGSEAGASIRQLSLAELGEALRGLVQPTAAEPARPVVVVAPAAAATTTAATDGAGESREVVVYKQILTAIEHEPLTIGQLSKRIDCDIDELRGYLAWMKKMGKIDSTGRARATRYHLPVG